MMPTMLSVLLLCCSLGSGAGGASIRRVVVEGNLRISTAAVLTQVSSSPGGSLDLSSLRRDVEKLHALGFFRQVEVETRSAGREMVDLVYRVREHPVVSEVEIEGIPQHLESRIREMLCEMALEPVPFRVFRPLTYHRMIQAIRAFLQADKYPSPEVELQSEETGGRMRVRIVVRPGPRLEIGVVRFLDNRSFPDELLLDQMKTTRPAGIWDLWSPAGVYTPGTLAEDLQRLRRFYLARGHAAVSIGEPAVRVETTEGTGWRSRTGFGGREQRLVIDIPVAEGPDFRLVSVRTEGCAATAQPAVAALMNELPTPCRYDYARLQSLRESIVGALGERGYALARVRLGQITDPSEGTVEAVFSIEAGSPVIVERIRFEGNRLTPDRYLRRELAIQEGEVFNSLEVDRSIKRLNRTGLIEPIQRPDVIVEGGTEEGSISLTFRIEEKNRHGIYATGGSNDLGGSYLGILYSAFNLLGLGERLSFELDGGAAESNVLLNFLGRHFLGSPFTLALSGFHRITGYDISGAVPDAADIAGIFSRRSTGLGASGAYSISDDVKIGLGLQMEGYSFVRNPVKDDAVTQPAAGVRSEVTPFFSIDSARGTGPETRGCRAAVGHSWIGRSFLEDVTATRESFQWVSYHDDPWTAGRNSFALQMKGAGILGGEDSFLDLGERIFPGTEYVRGFRPGGLTTWTAPSDGGSRPPQPAGADAVLGFSLEYRVPIHGRLSGTTFFDLGWSRLSPGRASEPEEGIGLVAATSNVLRSSMGGELRLRLPFIEQPARLIFAWNPLRMDRVVAGGASPLRLADPRGAFRFALGNLF